MTSSSWVTRIRRDPDPAECDTLIARFYEPDREPARPAVCLGSDPFHTTPELVNRGRVAAGAGIRGRGRQAVRREYGAALALPER